MTSNCPRTGRQELALVGFEGGAYSQPLIPNSPPLALSLSVLTSYPYSLTSKPYPLPHIL